MWGESIPKMIPLFPLPATVLFPSTYLPLHVFEPRYREMIQDALDGARVIGMTLLKDDWEKDYYGNPPIHGLGCAGKIVQVQRLGGGRFNIVLYGLERFTVKDQFFNKMYRQAWVEPLASTASAPRGLPGRLRDQLMGRVHDYARSRGWENQVEAFLSAYRDDVRLVHALSSELNLTPAEKQFLLESEDPVHQCRRLIDLIGFMVEEERSGKEADRRAEGET